MLFYIMDSFIKYVLPTATNYNIINYPNLFNFLYTMYIKLDDKGKKDFCLNMKLLIGMSFFSEFRSYLFRKTGDANSVIFD